MAEPKSRPGSQDRSSGRSSGGGAFRPPAPPPCLRSRLAPTAVVAGVAYALAAYVAPRLMGRGVVSPDFTGYYLPGALAIQRGDGFVGSTGAVITHYPPGFSLLIAPWVQEDVTRSLEALRHLAGVEAVLWVVLLAFLARRLVPALSLWVVLPLLTLWPALLAIGNPTTSELPFTVLITIGVALLAGFSRFASRSLLRGAALAALAGGVFAAASYVRPQGFAVAAAAALALAAGFTAVGLGRRLVAALSLLVVFTLLILPWMEVNRVHTGHFRFTSSGAIAMRAGVRELASIPFAARLAERASDWQGMADALQDATRLAAEDPVGAAHLAAVKIVSPWFRTWTRRFDGVLMFLQIPLGLLFVGTSVRVLLRWSRTPGEIILLHGVVCSLWGTAMIVVPLARYLAPSLPFVLLALLWQGVDLWKGATLSRPAA